MGISIQDMLGAATAIDTNVDVVFVIDGTQSMQPLIDKVKELTISFRNDLEKELSKNQRRIAKLRVKVIVFRDYYVDAEYAMQETDFFELPEENDAFTRYVSSIKSGGGGDEPESGLEALALAMNSDFVQEGTKKRHIIVLFTDASAHPLEMQKDGIPTNYPKWMYKSFDQLGDAWGGDQEFLGATTQSIKFTKATKRLVLFAPSMYPWSQIEQNFNNAIRSEMNKGNGGQDLELDLVWKLLAYSMG